MRRFISGTDTDAGKTFVTAALAREGVARGRKVFAWKPIETGCQTQNGQRIGSDGELIAAAAGNWQVGELRGAVRLEAPLSPLVAAEYEGATIDIDALRHILTGIECDDALVEGAGGLRVPITKEIDVLGLAKLMELPIVIVCRASLGTINHTVLSCEAARANGLATVVVMSKRPEVATDDAVRNAREIERMAGSRVHIFDGSDSPALYNFVTTAFAD